jgi:hypothetical protein
MREVFASDDLVRGPDLVVCAVRDDRKAAASIHKCLSAQKPARKRFERRKFSLLATALWCGRRCSVFLQRDGRKSRFRLV